MRSKNTIKEVSKKTAIIHVDQTESKNSTQSPVDQDDGKIEDLGEFYLQAEQILDTKNLKEHDTNRQTRLTRVTQYNLEERINKVK